ncbi:MAG: stalk domain-containing protein [Defluviitaleaceae bacterium]|nr:stalk domain-containing protein [Defluviitaleaceae bacterium]
MNEKVAMAKGIVMGVLVTVLLSGTIAMANPVVREILFGVSVYVNGVDVTFAEDSQPFIMGDRTFLPVAAMAEAFGFDIEWNAATATANITILENDGPAINPITVAEITALQMAWGEGLVAISTAYANDEDYASIAQGVLDTLYGYVDGIVLFKPTIAQEVPFRFTEAAAASYFIGGSIDEDGGFALNPWTAVRFGNDGQHIINGETALWMGSVFLTNGDGEEIRVEKSLGLYRDNNGDVRIQLHHSSVPFSE